MPIQIAQTNTVSSSQVNPPGYYAPWQLPDSLSKAFVKGTANSVNLSFGFNIKNYNENFELVGPNYTPLLKMVWTYENDDPLNPVVIELGSVFNFNTDYPLEVGEYYGKYFNAQLTFTNIDLLLPGDYLSKIKVKVIEIIPNTIVDEFEIPVTLTSYDAGTVLVNFSNSIYNFCLDNNFIEVNSSVAKFVNVKYNIHYKGEDIEVVSRYAIHNNYCKVIIGGEIQPYIYLSENEINQFFEIWKINMQPAIVDISIILLNEYFQEILTNEYPSILFHAGKSKNLPQKNSIIERSLSYNSWLPLVYEYETQMVDFKYKNDTKSFDKWALSSPTTIFQMMFIQKFHYADASKLTYDFSSGFSSGFLTEEAVLNANPLFLYEEGYLNLIESYYTIKGINFPWQINSINVIWLDENNNFHGMSFTGENEKNMEFVQQINSYPHDFKNKKVGASKKSILKLNTGWKLKSEVNELISLIEAKRCWFFGDTPQNKIEAVVITNKLAASSSGRSLDEFNIEFEINE